MRRENAGQELSGFFSLPENCTCLELSPGRGGKLRTFKTKRMITKGVHRAGVAGKMQRPEHQFGGWGTGAYREEFLKLKLVP